MTIQTLIINLTTAAGSGDEEYVVVFYPKTGQATFDVIGPFKEAPILDFCNYLDGEVPNKPYSIQTVRGDLRNVGLRINPTFDNWKAETHRKLYHDQ